MNFWLAFLCIMVEALLIFPWLGFTVLTLVIWLIACLPFVYEMYLFVRD